METSVNSVGQSLIESLFKDARQARAEGDLAKLEEVEKSYREQIESHRDDLKKELALFDNESEESLLSISKESLTAEERVKYVRDLTGWRLKRSELQASIEMCEFALRNTLVNYVSAMRDCIIADKALKEMSRP